MRTAGPAASRESAASTLAPLRMRSGAPSSRLLASRPCRSWPGQGELLEVPAPAAKPKEEGSVLSVLHRPRPSDMPAPAFAEAARPLGPSSRDVIGSG